MNKSEIVKESKRFEVIDLIFKVSISAMLIAMAFLIVGSIFFKSDIYFDYSDLETKIRILIEEEAGVEVIKHAYSENYRNTYSQFQALLNSDISRIKNRPNLEEILMSIQQAYYLERDTAMYKKVLIEKVLNNYRETDPFDILEEQQKYLFNNLRKTLDTSYYKISDDLVKISLEMKSKNRIVSEYLSSANASYRNSFIAVTLSFLSISIVLFNIYNRKKRESG